MIFKHDSYGNSKGIFIKKTLVTQKVYTFLGGGDTTRKKAGRETEKRTGGGGGPLLLAEEWGERRRDKARKTSKEEMRKRTFIYKLTSQKYEKFKLFLTNNPLFSVHLPVPPFQPSSRRAPSIPPSHSPFTDDPRLVNCHTRQKISLVLFTIGPLCVCVCLTSFGSHVSRSHIIVIFQDDSKNTEVAPPLPLHHHSFTPPQPLLSHFHITKSIKLLIHLFTHNPPPLPLLQLTQPPQPPPKI